ncbi:nucleotide disphospho-sugar-binding domain-containing protein [Actinocrispum wychmicini]|uniref:UDP:flavonoid glycosyltransferase YjiC (YdhE family) n=1 Tax=Actinocrispum wychmicini TaxID=1213861 RepID=A0A4R2JP43_9PSEU|nr:nucleotide disphospho-sugar-binding domain-containing protein [Actinocrispum wychmicini]TCO60522.1 UDP:flavonoid glycosyltransferase YjiC (YdhE family) [Actinocrispum wychmicini]
MRAFFVTSPGAGQVFPSISLAHALVAAGHQVRYALGGDLTAVTKAGLVAVDAAPDVDFQAIFHRASQTKPMTFGGGRIGSIFQLFGDISSVMVDRALAAALDWRPDIVLHTPMQGAGQLVAAALGLPAVQIPLGPAIKLPPMTGDPVRELLAEHYERHGVRGFPRQRVRISVTPPSFTHQDPKAWLMRYVPYNAGGVLPEWLTATPSRPRIVVCLGTVSPIYRGLAPIFPVVEAATKIDAEFVITLAGGDRTALGDLPDNVRTVDYVPLHALLEGAHGLIHHGGAGTTMTSLVAGVPQCVLPQGADNPFNSQAVVLRGVGICPETLDTASIEQLVDDEQLLKAADEVRAEIATLPSPAKLVEQLETLV